MKSDTRNIALHIHEGSGVYSPKPPHTPASFESIADFFKSLNLGSLFTDNLPNSSARVFCRSDQQLRCREILTE